MNFVKFGRQLKKYRTQAKLDQKQVAEMVGVSREFVSYVENGKKKPALETAIALAKAVGVTLYDLIN